MEYGFAELIQRFTNQTSFPVNELAPQNNPLALPASATTFFSGTNIDTAADLKARYGAARVWAVVTHGVLCGPAADRFADPDCAVDRVFVSDTIPVSNRPELDQPIDSGRLDVTSSCPDLSWILYHHHWNLSIRELR